MANTDKESWDVTAPVTATGYVGKAAEEIRLLRESVEDRLNKQHVEIAASGAGGEHLEGSARIHTATTAPTLLAIGAKDTAGDAANVSITGNEALAEGMLWAKTDGGYVLQVYAASGWRDIGYLPLAGGTVTGATTFSSTLIVTSAGSIAVNTNRFTVAGDTGNTVVAGTCSVAGDFKVNTTYFTVAAATGNTVVAGTLSATGDFKVNTTYFTVAASTGNTVVGGTLSATGDFKVNTNKFVVTALSGNTNVAGTLNSAGAFSVATNKLTVGTDGNLYSAGELQGQLTVTSGTTTIAGILTASAGSGGNAGTRLTGVASTLDGSIWYDAGTTSFKCRINGTTKTISVT